MIFETLRYLMLYRRQHPLVVKSAIFVDVPIIDVLIVRQEKLGAFPLANGAFFLLLQNKDHEVQQEPRETSKFLDVSKFFISNTAPNPGSLINLFLGVYVNGKKLTALVDSGSSESDINSSTSEKLRWKIIPSNTVCR